MTGHCDLNVRHPDAFTVFRRDDETEGKPRTKDLRDGASHRDNSLAGSHHRHATDAAQVERATGCSKDMASE